MIARGFKPVGWVAAVATAALGCYMLSLNVASERAELADLERQIVLAKRDIRSLQTELGTRGRLQQLEHWNADVLALSAPGSDQFLSDEFRLARYSAPEKSFEERARVRMASAEVPAGPGLGAPPERGIESVSSPLDRPVVRRASLVLERKTPFETVDKAADKQPNVTKPVPRAKLVKAAAAEAPASTRPAAAKASAPKASAPKATASKATASKATPKATAPKVAAKAPAKVAARKSAGLISSDLEREIAQAARAEKSSGGASGR